MSSVWEDPRSAEMHELRGEEEIGRGVSAEYSICKDYINGIATAIRDVYGLESAERAKLKLTHLIWAQVHKIGRRIQEMHDYVDLLRHLQIGFHQLVSGIDENWILNIFDGDIDPVLVKIYTLFGREGEYEFAHALECLIEESNENKIVRIFGERTGFNFVGTLDCLTRRMLEGKILTPETEIQFVHALDRLFGCQIEEKIKFLLRIRLSRGDRAWCEIIRDFQMLRRQRIRQLVSAGLMFQ